MPRRDSGEMIWSEAVQRRPRNPRSGKASHSPGRVSCAVIGGLNLLDWWVTTADCRISPIDLLGAACAAAVGLCPAAAAPILSVPFELRKRRSTPACFGVRGVFLNFWRFPPLPPPSNRGGKSDRSSKKPVFSTTAGFLQVPPATCSGGVSQVKSPGF